MSRPQSRVIGLIDWYQRATNGRPSPCRFTPSCSSYAREALELHGSRGGLWLTFRRLLRCRPFGPSGFDPVPRPGEHRRGRPHHHGDDALSTAPSGTGHSREGLMSQ